MLRVLRSRFVSHLLDLNRYTKPEFGRLANSGIALVGIRTMGKVTYIVLSAMFAARCLVHLQL
jgi:hypothetical protein